MSLGQPAFVVEDAPFLEGLVEFLDGVEVADSEELFLEGSDEALGDAVAPGFVDEGGAGPDTGKADFLLKMPAHVSGAVVVSEAEAAGGVGSGAAEVAADALADGFEGLEAVGAAGDVEADRLGGAVVHRDEHGDRSVTDGVGGGGVGSPHDIGYLGGDGSVVSSRKNDLLRGTVRNSV